MSRDFGSVFSKFVIWAREPKAGTAASQGQGDDPGEPGPGTDGLEGGGGGSSLPGAAGFSRADALDVRGRGSGPSTTGLGGGGGGPALP
jgi:hypothetical protein